MPARVELLAAVWELLSWLLFATAVAPDLSRSGAAAASFVVSLVVSAVAARTLWRRTRGGPIAVTALRAAAWAGVAALVDPSGATLLVATLFGVMAGSVRVACYLFGGEEERTADLDLAFAVKTLQQRLEASTTATGVVAGHVLLLFSVAFFRTTSAQIQVAWRSALPLLGAVATALFTVAVRVVVPPILGGMRERASAEERRDALVAAERAPLRLSLMNFAMWAGGAAAAAFAAPAEVGFSRLELMVLVLIGLLFGWGVTLYQRTWQRAILSPIVERLRQEHSDLAPARGSLRVRLLVDFGMPLLVLAWLFLIATLGLSTALLRERGTFLRAGDAAALVAAVTVLGAATAGIVVRVARELARPIDRLCAATTRVSSGALDQPLPALDAPEEVAGLGRAVEAMRLALVRTIDELEGERQGLERRVEERTTELRTALAELQEAQAALIHREKMVSLGQLVAGVAHEINNPLNAIRGSVSTMPTLLTSVRDMLAAYEVAAGALPAAQREALAQRRVELDVDAGLDDLDGMARVVDRAAARGARIVDGLRRFSRSTDAHAPVQLEEGLDETIALLGPAAREAQVTVERVYGKIPEVIGDGGEINQVFMNLLSNALAAASSRPAGRVVVTTSQEEGAARVVIDDSGPGVPDELRHRIFEPFFTTKATGEGTGLGLSISARIIERHGGTVSVSASPLGGARFVVDLPSSGPRHSPEGAKGR